MPTATTKRWTYADYCRIPPDRNRHEIIDGVHYVNPAPTPWHQTVSRRLQYELMTAIELPGLGEVFDAPIDVHLGRGALVQPDLVVVLRRNLRIDQPDLAHPGTRVARKLGAAVEAGGARPTC